MNKKFLSLIVVVLMVFQTITSTAFAQSSTTEENNAATLNETTVAQMGVSVNRKNSSTAYIMYMSPIEDSSETFTAYYAIDTLRNVKHSVPLREAKPLIASYRCCANHQFTGGYDSLRHQFLQHHKMLSGFPCSFFYN